MNNDEYHSLPMTTDDYWWLPMTTNDYFHAQCTKKAEIWSGDTDPWHTHSLTEDSATQLV